MSVCVACLSCVCVLKSNGVCVCVFVRLFSCGNVCVYMYVCMCGGL